MVKIIIIDYFNLLLVQLYKVLLLIKDKILFLTKVYKKFNDILLNIKIEYLNTH
jgi:hypothetical protein